MTIGTTCVTTCPSTLDSKPCLFLTPFHPCQVNLVLQQLQGLCDGYNSSAFAQEHPLPCEALLAINLDGDMEDLADVLEVSLLSQFQRKLFDSWCQSYGVKSSYAFDERCLGWMITIVTLPLPAGLLLHN